MLYNHEKLSLINLINSKQNFYYSFKYLKGYCSLALILWKFSLNNILYNIMHILLSVYLLTVHQSYCCQWQPMLWLCVRHGSIIRLWNGRTMGHCLLHRLGQQLAEKQGLSFCFWLCEKIRTGTNHPAVTGAWWTGLQLQCIAWMNWEISHTSNHTYWSSIQLSRSFTDSPWHF